MENDLKQRYSIRNIEWIYTSFDNFIYNLELKEEKCKEMNKSKVYSYIVESCICNDLDFPYRIVIKAYKKV